MWDPTDLGYPRAVLLGLAAVTVLALVVAASTSSAAFGAYNAKWDGAADLRGVAADAGADATVVRNVSAYRSAPDGAVAVVLSPDRAYTAREAAAVREFVRGGGTLLLAEDYGAHANDLLAATGAGVRFGGAPVRDERRNYRSPAMPVAGNVTDHPLTAGVDALTLNHGTVLRPGNATVLVRTSEFGYVDRNRNGALDDNETLARYPVAAVERVGDGRVVAVADPSLFINAMLDRGGNRRFARNVLGTGPRVLLDYSHATGIPPLALALLAVRGSAVLQALLAGAGLAAVGAWGRGSFASLAAAVRRRTGRDRPEGPGMRAEEMRAYLEREHPDWSRERIRRVVEAAARDAGEERRR